MVNSEIPVPSGRVGLLIGRQGETIQRLQAESGARLQMIQDDPTAEFKPLKISGDAEQVAKAEALVRDLLDVPDPLDAGPGGALVPVGSGVMENMAPLGSSGGPDDENEYRSQVGVKTCLMPS